MNARAPPIWLALAGAPGAGKSTLCELISNKLDAPVVSKDLVREAMFGSKWTTYTRQQDDVVMQAVYSAACYHTQSSSVRLVLIDGRTFGDECAIRGLRDAARSAGARSLLVRLDVSEAVLRRRVQHDEMVRRAAVDDCDDGRKKESWIGDEAESNVSNGRHSMEEKGKVEVSSEGEVGRHLLRDANHASGDRSHEKPHPASNRTAALLYYLQQPRLDSSLFDFIITEESQDKCQAQLLQLLDRAGCGELASM
mmetsp:Transcript_14773/g.37690  ORF Transcript_14773/g.37690 Transcript_14773/m.37690 type:complete len:253 (-) Transcript_14773:1814-2572(-)